MVSSPTRCVTILDYCLVRSNKDASAMKCEVIESRFSDHRAILLNLGRGSVKCDTKGITKWSIFSEIVKKAWFNQVTWEANESVDDLAMKITDWLKFYANCTNSVEDAKMIYHSKQWFSEELQQVR